jgi:hypothetical protein
MQGCPRPTRGGWWDLADHETRKPWFLLSQVLLCSVAAANQLCWCCQHINISVMVAGGDLLHQLLTER